nr:ARID DNA-binding domain-containing protein [Tanacetum cinerariifolium]
MVHYKRIMQHNWLGYKPVQQWYQSHGSKLWEKPIHKHDHVVHTRRYLQRETPKRLFPWNSRKKCLSPESKEMLVKRMKEVEAFNASKMSAKTRDHAKKIASTRKEKRARCYICKERGHVFWKCQNKRKDARIEKQKELVKPTNKNVAEKIKYREQVHVITEYMIKGTYDATWEKVWYVSSAYKNHMCPKRSLFKKLKYKFKMIEKEETKKKFIFLYGVGNVTVKAREGNFVIPNVHYTPEVTLNQEQERHKKKDSQKMMDGEYISWNGSLYALKMLKWFYLVHLNYDMLEEIPPVIGVMEINLLGLHKTVDSLGVYYETTKMPWYEKKPKEDVAESSNGNARVKDPQCKENDDAGIEEALEEDMNKKTQLESG